MVVDGTTEMADARSAGFVATDTGGGNKVFGSGDVSFGSLRGCCGSGYDDGRSGCSFGAVALGGIGA